MREHIHLSMGRKEYMIVSNVKVIFSFLPVFSCAVAAAVIEDAEDMHLRVCGPAMLPNRVTHITTRLNGGGN